PPAAPVITLTDNSGSVHHLTNEITPTLTINAEAGSTVQVYQDGVLVGTATQTAPGVFHFASAALGDGNYSFTATATDPAGNTSPLAGASPLRIYDPAPAAPVITFTGGDGIVEHLTNNTTPTLTINAEAGSTVQVFQNGQSVGPATEKAPGVFSFTSAALTDGNYNFTATATDLAGNTSATSAAFAITIDHTAPTVTAIAASGTGIDANGNGDLNAGHLVHLTLTMSEAVTVTGTPTLSLNDGGTASYNPALSNPATVSLVFDCTVASGHNRPDLAVSSFNTLFAFAKLFPATNLAGTASPTSPAGAIHIDPTAPAVTAIVASGTGIDANG